MTLPALSRLHLSVEGSTALLRIDHGKANEMGTAALDDLDALCGALETGEIRTLLTYSDRTSSKGTPIFISGADVTERVGWDDARVKAHVGRQRATLARLRAAPLFHVAVVHGLALGWGTEFCLVADWRIATPGARFGLPETGLGILPGAGGTADLPALVGLQQALRLGMTGEVIAAAEARQIGLVDELADDLAAGLARARALADMVARRSPTAVAAFKAAALEAIGRDPSARRALEARAYEHCVDTGEAAIGRANFAGIVAGQGAPWSPFRPFRP